MQIYLPIAEMSVNAFTIAGLGALVGFLSGLFGVGGGFLMTPILIFFGVPPAVAVGTQGNQLVAASLTSVLTHWRRGTVDFKLGLVMLVGGYAGTAFGVWMMRLLKKMGHIDVAISLSYVFLLGIIGILMLIEAVPALFRNPVQSASRSKLHQHHWAHRLPFKMRFHRSKLYISALLPAGIGAFGGILVSLGMGGGFFLVPAMIYLLNMPTALVAGTSLFQILFTAAFAALLQAVTNQTVDVVLALLLIVGGVIGAQIGTKVGAGLRSEYSRLLLGLLVLGVGLRLAWDLVVPPVDLYNLTTGIAPGDG